jgi:hypothetical protein
MKHPRTERPLHVANRPHVSLLRAGSWVIACGASLALLDACSTRQGTLAPDPTTNTGGVGGGAGSAAHAGSGGAAGAGADVGAGPTTSTSSTSTSSTGPACSPVGLQGDCGAGQKCTVVDAATGEAGCIAAGVTADYAACLSNANCGPGSWCDEPTGVCKPVCGDTEDCTNAGFGTCLQARLGGQLVQGMMVCTAHCSPTALDPCGADVNCVLSGAPNDSDCYLSGGKDGLDVCTESRECAPGLVCAPDGYCVEWCPEAEIGQCCGLCLASCTPCQPLDPPLFYGGVAMPACWDVMSC